MNKKYALNHRMLATAVGRIRQNCKPGNVTFSGQWAGNHRTYRDLLKSLDDIVGALDINTVTINDSDQHQHQHRHLDQF